mgnify:CR=1 FL=1
MRGTYTTAGIDLISKAIKNASTSLSLRPTGLKLHHENYLRAADSEKLLAAFTLNTEKVAAAKNSALEVDIQAAKADNAAAEYVEAATDAPPPAAKEDAGVTSTPAGPTAVASTSASQAVEQQPAVSASNKDAQEEVATENSGTANGDATSAAEAAAPSAAAAAPATAAVSNAPAPAVLANLKPGAAQASEGKPVATLACFSLGGLQVSC